MNNDEIEARMRALESYETVHGQSVSFKNDLLSARGINFNEAPAWQRRGVGLYCETYEKDGFNPVTRQPVTATRRRIRVDRDLPVKDQYTAFIRNLRRRTEREEVRT